MNLAIVLRKEVASVEQGQSLIDIVGSKLSEYPDIAISGSVGQSLEITPPPEVPE